MDKYDMLAIRACKSGVDKSNVIRRLIKILSWKYLYDFDKNETPMIVKSLFDICVELYKDDDEFVYWAAGLGDPDIAMYCGAPADENFNGISSFYEASLYQIISKLRYTELSHLPDDYIVPLRFRKIRN